MPNYRGMHNVLSVHRQEFATLNRSLTGSHSLKIYLTLLVVFILGLIKSAEAQTTSQYKPPNLSKKFIDIKQLSLSSEQRKTIATLMGEYEQRGGHWVRREVDE